MITQKKKLITIGSIIVVNSTKHLKPRKVKNNKNRNSCESDFYDEAVKPVLRNAKNVSFNIAEYKLSHVGLRIFFG